MNLNEVAIKLICGPNHPWGRAERPGGLHTCRAAAPVNPQNERDREVSLFAPR